MVFHSKIDNSFKLVIAISIFIIGLTTFSPILLDGNIQLIDIAVLVTIFVITVGFILWIVLSITYIFCQGHLLVKGGPFRSRIKYEEITRVVKTKDMFTGYRLLTSSDAIEIMYRSGVWGSVKISPKEMDLFINEIKKRCPDAKIEE